MVQTSDVDVVVHLGHAFQYEVEQETNCEVVIFLHSSRLDDTHFNFNYQKVRTLHKIISELIAV